MTITADNVITYLDKKLKERQLEFTELQNEIKAMEKELLNKKEYAAKLSFFNDKFDKIVATVEMDKKNKKPFEEIHKNF